jgi:CDP-diglyceride synthetase
LWEFANLVFGENTPFRRLRQGLLVLLGFLPTVFWLTAWAVDDSGSDAVSSVADWMGMGGLANALKMLQMLPTFLLGVCCAVPLLLLLVELFLPGEAGFAHFGKYLTGLVYLGIPLLLPQFLATWDGDFQPFLMLGILLIVWTNDVAAYLIGSLIGKRKLFPRISPNKTWEGTLSGLAVSLLLGVGLGYLMPFVGFDDISPLQWAGLAATCALFGTLGDLVESMLKRGLHIKDSGSVLPGHGGFLDRFDALILALPFAAAYLFFC